jgi:hypothetical protein
MLASGVADHALHLDNHLPGLERLAKEAAASAHAPGARASILPGIWISVKSNAQGRL